MGVGEGGKREREKGGKQERVIGREREREGGGGGDTTKEQKMWYDMKLTPREYLTLK